MESKIKKNTFSNRVGVGDHEVSYEGREELIKEALTNLYKNPCRAVVRELYSNSCDATEDDSPIEFHLDDNMFSVKDHGCGMSEEELRENFLTYGNSSKRYDNSKIGMFGFGAKSPLSIVDSFTVVSCDGKECNKAEVYLKDGGIYGKVESLPLRERGTTVSFSPKGMFKKLKEETEELAFYSPRNVAINGKTPRRLYDVARELRHEGGFSFYVSDEENVTEDVNLIFVFRVGDVSYISGKYDESKVNVFSICEEDIWNVKFTPSRESISDKSVSEMKNRAYQIIDSYTCENFDDLALRMAFRKIYQIKMVRFGMYTDNLFNLKEPVVVKCQKKSFLDTMYLVDDSAKDEVIFFNGKTIPEDYCFLEKECLTLTDEEFEREFCNNQKVVEALVIDGTPRTVKFDLENGRFFNGEDSGITDCFISSLGCEENAFLESLLNYKVIVFSEKSHWESYRKHHPGATVSSRISKKNEVISRQIGEKVSRPFLWYRVDDREKFCNTVLKEYLKIKGMDDRADLIENVMNEGSIISDKKKIESSVIDNLPIGGFDLSPLIESLDDRQKFIVSTIDRHCSDAYIDIVREEFGNEDLFEIFHLAYGDGEARNHFTLSSFEVSEELMDSYRESVKNLIEAR